MLLAVAAACSSETIEVPGETVIVEKEVIKEVQVPGETVVVEKEVVKTVEVPGPERVVVKEVPSGKNYVTDPTTGKVVTAPEYGGTLTFARKSMGAEPHFVSGFLEKLSVGDWGIDRDETDWRTTYVPVPSLIGALAESWEQPDPLTWIAHIRKGVHWQDKPPVNGRELTAYDVEYNYHRHLGIPDKYGFTEPPPYPASKALGAILESVTATDDWTVVFKLKGPNVGAERLIFDNETGFIYPPGIIKQGGDATVLAYNMPALEDWRDLVGTGPYMLTDYVEGSSVTWIKNPNYWGFDEKYPQNRLPYIDELRALIMPEVATQLAALRTAKLDYVGSHGDTQLKSIDQVVSLQRTNPEIVLHQYYYRSDNSFIFNGQNVVDNPPFNDIRVRRAMQMALDLETLNATYFKGYGNTTPEGVISTDVTGYAMPFEDWPEDVKKVFDYDPAGARQLLAEAGYPEGIKTTLVHNQGFDLSYAELAATYWSDIGIDVEITVVDGAAFGPLAGKTDGSGIFSSTNPGLMSQSNANRGGFYYLPHYATAGFRGFNDPAFDAMSEAAITATTIEEQKRIVREANMLIVKEQWVIWGPESPQFQAHQPWVKGYNGELWIGRNNFYQVFARLWIDSEMKEAMGY